MKICLVHNSYEQRGGEDVVFEQEKSLLERAGHEVIVYHRSNAEIHNGSLLVRTGFLKNAIWSTEARTDFSKLLDREAPGIVHVHNTFFMISPSIYSTCRERGIPVVQTLHNFRWFCPAYTFYRQGGICEDCLKGSLLNSVRHGCYRNSKPATAMMAAILASQRFLHTWQESIDCYIALTEFARSKFISAGLDPGKIFVKPNFVSDDPGPRIREGDYALFVGRLSEEKGTATLLGAWERISAPCPLRIIGDGPDSPSLRREAVQRNMSSIVFLGSLPREEVITAIKGARFLIVPSLWYEGFPMTIAEAFACGTPVLCSRLGAMREIVTDHGTGLHFNPGDAGDLAEKVDWAWSHPAEVRELGRMARREYEDQYTAKRNYALLMAIYERELTRTQLLVPVLAH